MKKFMTLAVASILSMSAFAQDVYKQISKIKDYNEAYNLLKVTSAICQLSKKLNATTNLLI